MNKTLNIIVLIIIITIVSYHKIIIECDIISHNTLTIYNVTSKLNTTKRVILSSGLINWNVEQLTNQFNTFRAYRDMGLITDTSILVYTIDENGLVGTHQPNASITSEEYQRAIKEELGLGAYPCFYCDTTIGMCDEFVSMTDRLNKLFTHVDRFINITIDNANKYSWDGYYVDIELRENTDTVKLTNFIVRWANALAKINKTLNVWIGGTQYNDNVLYENNNVLLTTMNTYNLDYKSFISVASQYHQSIKSINRMSYGLLTYDNLHNYTNIITNEEDMLNIINWSKIANPYALSLWASHIPSTWYKALYIYLNGEY